MVISVAVGAAILLTEFTKKIRMVLEYDNWLCLVQLHVCSLAPIKTLMCSELRHVTSSAKMTVFHAVQGSSLYQFRHTTLYAWNIAVGVVLLSSLSAFFSTFLWRICVVAKQKKRW